MQWFLMIWSVIGNTFVMAIIVAILIELVGITRVISAFHGFIRNQFAARSVANLRKRIAQLEEYRAVLESYRTSELFLVLALFKFVLGMLTLMCVGAATILLNRILPPWHPVPEPIGSIVLLFGVLVTALAGIFGMKTAELNTPSKLTAQIAPVDAEISKLKVKLASRISSSG
jgi:hypothetical protein